MGVGSAQCPQANSCITGPVANETVKGIIPIIGTASHENFLKFKVEWRPESRAGWIYLLESTKPVVGGELMQWWTMTVPPGATWLRITVIDKTGNYLPAAELRVFVAPQ